MRFCLCGCGKQIKDNKKYILGHNRRNKEPWNKGKTNIYSEYTIEKMRIASLRKNLSNNTITKMSDARKDKEVWNKNKKNIYNEKTLQLMSKKRKRTIKQIKKRYPLFFKIEEMRYNPDKSSEKEIQVHCKNHNCPNSKEKDGWFTPGKYKFYERIRQIEYGQAGCYFYCSNECKKNCILSYIRNDPFKIKEKNSYIYYNKEEYQQFREFVLERDNYECQYCEEKAEHVHHERPQKLEPFFSLDPDYAWSVCSKCHYEKGHKDECSTGNLSSIICN